jgi:hypothetical protein
VCNSWLPDTYLKPLTHWLEEVVVNALSIRALGFLADSWDFNADRMIGRRLRGMWIGPPRRSVGLAAIVDASNRIRQ